MPEHESTKEQPSWRRLPGESAQAFAAFEAYLRLTDKRTVLAAYRALNPESDARRAPTWWRQWHTAWEWQQRALDHDNMLLAEAEAKAAEELAAEVMELERKRIALRRKQLEVGEALVARAEKLLERPIERMIDADGSVVIEPAGWSQDSIPRLAEAGFDLQSKATFDVTDDLTREIAKRNKERVGEMTEPLTPEAEASAYDLLRSLGDTADRFERLQQDLSRQQHAAAASGATAPERTE